MVVGVGALLSTSVWVSDCGPPIFPALWRICPVAQVEVHIGVELAVDEPQRAADEAGHQPSRFWVVGEVSALSTVLSTGVVARHTLKAPTSECQVFLVIMPPISSVR